MPRDPRIRVAGATYHVWSKAARGLMLYLDDHDRRAFDAIAGIAVSKARWICHAYCQVGTHYHFMFETPEPNLDVGMKRLNWLYSRTFNERHGMRGHLFESRYGYELVQSPEHFLRAYRYIARNPVEAGIVRSAADWPWGGYAATVGLGRVPRFLTTRLLLESISDDPEVAKRHLRWIVEGIDPKLGSW